MKLLPLYICLFLIISCAKPERDDQNSGQSQPQQTTAIQPLEQKRFPMYTSLSGGKLWNDASSGLPKDLLVSFIDTFDQKLIIGTESKGLFISDASRTKWVTLSPSLSDKKINALHIAGDEIFIAIFREGIFNSKDGGKTWTSLNGDLKDVRIKAILKIGNAILVGADHGIYQSIAEQTKWKTVFQGNQVVSLNMYDGKITAGSTGGVLLSEDNGANWQWIHEMGAIHNTAILEGVIVAMYISNDLFVSEDWGNSWTLAEYAPKLGSYIYEAAQIYDHFIMSNNYGIHRSIDKGKTWELIYPTDEAIFFDFLVWDSIVYGGTRE